MRITFCIGEWKKWEVVLQYNLWNLFTAIAWYIKKQIYYGLQINNLYTKMKKSTVNTVESSNMKAIG